MKRYILLLSLILGSIISNAQWIPVGNTLQRQVDGTGFKYRFSLGSPGFYNITDSIRANNFTFSNGLTKEGLSVKLGGFINSDFVVGNISNSNKLSFGSAGVGANKSYSFFGNGASLAGGEIYYGLDILSDSIGGTGLISMSASSSTGLKSITIGTGISNPKGIVIRDDADGKGIYGSSNYFRNYNPSSDSLLYAQYGGVNKLIDDSHVFDGMRIKGGSVDAFPVSKHLVINAVDPGPLRMHLEPKGFIDNGLASKLDYMMDPFDQGLASYRLFNIFSRVGNFAGLNGENGLAFLGTKSTGEHVPQYPGLHFGFNDDASDAVPMKMYYFESTAAATWLTPMRGLWRTGMPITANDYVNVGLRLYKATGTGTTGTIKPVHTSGTVSDGSISFEYIRSVVTGSMRPTVFFGDRDLMPLHGLPETRAQFAKNATFWNGAKTEFASSTLNRHYDLGTNTGSDDLVLRNISNSQTLTMKSTGGVELNTTIQATNVSGTNTGDQSLSFADGGMVTLSGAAGSTQTVSSIGLKSASNGLTVPATSGVYGQSITAGTNFPTGTGMALTSIRTGGSLVGAFRLTKAVTNNSDIFFETGATSTTWNASDIILGKNVAAGLYQTLAKLSTTLTPSAVNYPNVDAVNTGLALKANLTDLTLQKATDGGETTTHVIRVTGQTNTGGTLANSISTYFGGNGNASGLYYSATGSTDGILNWFGNDNLTLTAGANTLTYRPQTSGVSGFDFNKRVSVSAALNPGEAVTLGQSGTKQVKTASGTGIATTISIAHGMTGVTSASWVSAIANNSASAGIQYVTIDATNINIIYTVAPVTGTNNLLYSIEIKP